MVETRINSATSATVKNRAFAWDSTLASLLRACWHCTPLWLLWPVSKDAGGLGVAELLGALGGFPYCLDEGAAHAAAFQRAQAGRRRAAGRRHRGPVFFGGLAGLGQEAGGAEHGLDDECRRRRPRQPGEDTGLDERLGDEEEVGGART